MKAARQTNAKAMVSRDTVRSFTPRTGLLASGAAVRAIANPICVLCPTLALRFFLFFLPRAICLTSVSESKL